MSNFDIKSKISKILVNNGFVKDFINVQSSFDYKVIRGKWTPEDDQFKFSHLTDAVNDTPLEESETERNEYKNHLLNKENISGTHIPRIVLVNYVEDEGYVPDYFTANNVKPPVGDFDQKGMVINLETEEVLNVGNSWINTLRNREDLEALKVNIEVNNNGVVQKPIEGASVSIFYSPSIDEIFIGTNKRVLKISKILLGGGSRWNFYGVGATEDNYMSTKFDIHRSVLMILMDIAMQQMSMTSFKSETDTEYASFVNMIVKSVFFPEGNENVVYSGILSGKPFAGQSRSMTDEDYDSVSLTVNNISRRVFNKDTMKTIWKNTTSDRGLYKLFEEYSLDMNKFKEEAVNGVSNDNWNCFLSDSDEDILIIEDMEYNGKRRITKYQPMHSIFRDMIIRGGSDEELKTIQQLIPLHRNRKFVTAANIRERVQQVVSLCTRTTTKFTFDSIYVLGSEGSINMYRALKTRISDLVDDSLGNMIHNWEDVAYPLSRFLINDPASKKEVLIQHGIEENLHYKILDNPVNDRLCNALAVLYASVSQGLKEVVIDEISRYFVSRAYISMAAFLPENVQTVMERSYIQAIQDDPYYSNYKNNALPIGVHKLRKITPFRNMKPSQRKYKIGELVTELSYPDIKFIMNYVNYPRSRDVYCEKYHQLIISY